MEPDRAQGGSINLKYTQMEEGRQHKYNTKTNTNTKRHTNTILDEVHTDGRRQRAHTVKVKKERVG